MTLPTFVEPIHDRYNPVELPAAVFALLCQTLTDEALRAQVTDQHLLAGVPV